MASDYCYSDRLHFRSYDLFLQPIAFGLCLLQHNLPAVRFFPSRDGTFPDEMSFRLLCTFPEGFDSSFRLFVAEALHFLKPCDSVVERTFPVFVDLLNTRY